MSNKIEKAVKVHFHSQRRSLGADLSEQISEQLWESSVLLVSRRCPGVWGLCTSNESGDFEHQTVTHPPTLSEQSRLQDETSEGSKVDYFFFCPYFLISFRKAEHGEGCPMNCIIINMILFFPFRGDVPRRPPIWPMPLALMVWRLYKGILWWKCESPITCFSVSH